MGVLPGNNSATGGADVGALRTAGVPVVDLNQDGSLYFDIHHTANDTLYAIDPAALRQNVAVRATSRAPRNGSSDSADGTMLRFLASRKKYAQRSISVRGASLAAYLGSSRNAY